MLIACESTQILATIFAVLGFVIPAINIGYALFVWIYAFLAFVIVNFIKVAVVRHLQD